MKWICIFMIIFSGVLKGEEIEPIETSHAPKDSIFDKTKNPPLTSHSHITSKVNIVTGEFLEQDCDLIVAGSEPLSLRRFYGHYGSYHPVYNYWRFNPEHYCLGNLEWSELPQFVSVGDKNGNITCYEGKLSEHSFCFVANKQPHVVKLLPDGKTHPLNTKISFVKTDLRKEGGVDFFRYRGEIVEGNGNRKTFLTDIHSWTAGFLRYCIYPPTEDPKYSVSPAIWTPFEMPIQEERRPNGNIICYVYENLPSPDGYPGYKLLRSISAYNASRSKLLGSLTFNYFRTGWHHDVIEGMDVIGSDGRKVKFGYCYLDLIEHGEHLKAIASVNAPNKPPVTYSHDKGKKMRDADVKRLKQIDYPDGRCLATEFDKDTGKVIAQYAPVGPNGEMCVISRYNYGKQWTEVFDAEGNKTIYQFDQNKRITAIEMYDKGKICRLDRYTWDLQTGNLLCKTIEEANGKVVFRQEFRYDAHQNPIVEKIGDDKESYLTYRTFSKDGLNLLLSEKDDFGKNIVYTYVPGTNLLASEIIYDQTNRPAKRTFHFYDDCGICTKTIVDDGKKEKSDDLTGINYRRITVRQPRYVHPCFGLPEVVEERTVHSLGHEILVSKVIYKYAPSGKILKEDHYDADNKFRYSIKNEYDAKERLIATTDPLGQKTTFTYDANNNLLSQTGPDGHKKEWIYDKANRPLCEKDAMGLTQLKRYDKMGRMIATVDECGFETLYIYDALGRLAKVRHPDGAFETHVYNALGAIVKEVDSNGYETRKTVNFHSKPTSIFYPDGSKEFYNYSPDGKLIYLIDKNGAKTKFTRDIFGRVTKEETLGSDGKLIKKNECVYATFFPLVSTDPTGVLTTTHHDFAGKKVVEAVGHQATTFKYDALGRLITKRTPYSETTFTYDLIGQVLEEKETSLHGELLKKEEYKYDPCGHCISLTTPKGTTETCYNCRGEPTLIKDPQGNIKAFTYHHESSGFTKIEILPNGVQKVHLFDSRGREKETSTLDAEGTILQKTTRRFDGAGNLLELLEHIYCDGKKTECVYAVNRDFGPCNHVKVLEEGPKKRTVFTYDDKGRIETITKPDGTLLTYAYDVLGRLIHFVSKDTDLTYQYDHLGNIVSVFDGLTTTETSRIYDSSGRLLQENLANGISTYFEYDLLGRRVSMSLPDSTKVTYTYKANDLESVAWKNLVCRYGRDLEGCVTSVQLPGNSGALEIERDSLSRWKMMSAPFYKITFPKNGYDAVGNLCHYTVKDSQGTVDVSLAYDPLNHLIAENDHTFAFDSFHNRIRKDDVRSSYNANCQQKDDGYSYDPNGNLLSDNECNYTYDSQDRLIRVKKGNCEYSYTYDPFDRCLSKSLFTNGVKKNTVYYWWDGDHEIGLMDEKRVIQEVQILGEGVEGKPSASIMSLKGNLYTPIHDYQGSLVTLIDHSSQKPVETCRYTAFGEENASNPRAPWRFVGQRKDFDTGLIRIGKRYYHPSLGKWLTPNHTFLEENPYAYQQGNPYFFQAKEKTPLPRAEVQQDKGCGCSCTDYECMQTKIYDLSDSK